MSLGNRPLESLAERDLQALIDNQVAEGKTIEYKQDLRVGTGDEKKEFLYDVSSFANASGGHLVFGIKEDAGVPTDIFGLDIADLDSTLLKIENMIRDGIAPRIPGVTIRAISLQNTKVALVIHIPRSFAQPHMVIFKNASKFYSRNSAGKYQLNVGELRTAFTLSQNIIDRIRNFRRERLSAIVAEETPVPINPGAKLVLHIIPIGAFDPANSFDIVDIASLYTKNCELFEPLKYYGSTDGWSQRHNFDGHLTYSLYAKTSYVYTYLQTFRNGIIEAVDTTTITIYQNRKVLFKEYETIVLQGMQRFFLIQKSLGVDIPLLIMLSLLGVKDYVMSHYLELNLEGRSSFGNPIDRDVLIIPEVMVEDFNFEPARVMKPIFDAVWNAAGWPRSYNYDEGGNWVG